MSKNRKNESTLSRYWFFIMLLDWLQYVNNFTTRHDNAASAESRGVILQARCAACLNPCDSDLYGSTTAEYKTNNREEYRDDEEDPCKVSRHACNTAKTQHACDQCNHCKNNSPTEHTLLLLFYRLNLV